MSKPSSRISINQDILFLDHRLKDEGLFTYSIPWFVAEKRRDFIHFRNLEGGWPWQGGGKVNRKQVWKNIISILLGE